MKKGFIAAAFAVAACAVVTTVAVAKPAAPAQLATCTNVSLGAI